MEKYIATLIEEVNDGLHSIHLEENDIFTKASQAVKLLENVFGSLKSYISGYSFENETDEILFFKEIKPNLFSKLIYYRKIYNIEIMRPNGSLEVQKMYFKKELDKCSLSSI